MAKSISELNILTNFMADKTVTQRISANCLLPPGQLQLQNLLEKNNIPF